MSTTTTKPTLLPAGNHPGFARHKSQTGCFPLQVGPETSKKRPEYADYREILQLSGGERAFVLLWVHADSSLRLRLEMMNS
jgi:hypothetical protein